MTYIEKVKKSFSDNSDPVLAVGMKQYMRNLFEFLGIRSPIRSALSKPLLNEFRDLSQFEVISKGLWVLPEREYQYFTIDFLIKSKKFWKREHILLFEELIVSKSWWDTVDGLASNVIGEYFKRFPEEILPVTEKWMESGNIWLQRTCLIFQLKYGAKTDSRLLFSYCIDLMSSNEFFIQKAIGWSLRQYAKKEPEAVRDFVVDHPLKPLSRREALKHIPE